MHALLSLRSESELLGSPRLGASWEGFALEETVRRLKMRAGDFYFWAVHEESELDLMYINGGRRVGFEFKYTDAPRATRSMRRAIDVLGLESLTVVIPRGETYQIDERIRVTPLAQLPRAS